MGAWGLCCAIFSSRAGMLRLMQIHISAASCSCSVMFLGTPRETPFEACEKASKKARNYGLFFRRSIRRFTLAEKEGFEPSRQSPQPTPLAGEPLTATWVLLHTYRLSGRERGNCPAMPPNMTMPKGHSHIWRRERDSNPRCLAASPVFKTGSINHSDISPGIAFVL